MSINAFACISTPENLTPASKMPQVDKSIIKDRARRLESKVIKN